MKTLYSDILYKSKILYNVNCICTNVPVKLEFGFISTEIQFNLNWGQCQLGTVVFAQMYQLSLNLDSLQQKFSLTSIGDKQCRCIKGLLHKQALEILGLISCWVILDAFLAKADFFQNQLFPKQNFMNTIRVSSSFNPDQAGHFVKPDLDPNCLQNLKADHTSLQRVKE